MTLIPKRDLTPEQQLIRELHQTLYPERYWLDAEERCAGVQFDGGYSQWSPDTPESLANALDAFGESYPGLLDHQPTPRRLRGREAAIRARVAKAMREAGWVSVAEDVEDGVAFGLIERRLREIGEGRSEAAQIIAYLANVREKEEMRDAR